MRQPVLILLEATCSVGANAIGSMLQYVMFLIEVDKDDILWLVKVRSLLKISTLLCFWIGQYNAVISD